jgi:hypothetical protein
MQLAISKYFTPRPPAFYVTLVAQCFNVAAFFMADMEGGLPFLSLQQSKSAYGVLACFAFGTALFLLAKYRQYRLFAIVALAVDVFVAWPVIELLVNW